MAILNLINFASITDSTGQKHTFGSLSTAKQITCAGHVESRTFTIGTETTVKVWDSTESPSSNFDFMAIEVDRNAMLEMITDDDNSVGQEQYTVGLLGSGTAGIPGPPYMLSRDDSYANFTTQFAGGTLDVITTLYVRNLDASNSLQCQIFLVT